MERVAVVGLGKVGELVAILLRDAGFDVVGLDTRPQSGPTRVLDVSDGDQVVEALAEVDAVVACLPFALNGSVARAAAAAGVHYFDLTEDVPTTALVRELAGEHGDLLFAPQCGLAPGLIGIVGASLLPQFERVRALQLRVGALPQHPTGLLGYAFNWSPEGVVNEYLNECEVLRGGKRRSVPAMTEVETVVIGGIPLEAFLTSGGLGAMCETYEDVVQQLDYKTLRYPGHCSLLRFFFDELRLREDPALGGRILVSAKPPVDDDVVYLYAAAEGWRGGELARHEYVRAWRPRDIAGRRWRAISWTTAASACAVVELVARGEVGANRGFLRQESVPLDALLATRSGSLLSGGHLSPPPASPRLEDMG